MKQMRKEKCTTSPSQNSSLLSWNEEQSNIAVFPEVVTTEEVRVLLWLVFYSAVDPGANNNGRRRVGILRTLSSPLLP